MVPITGYEGQSIAVLGLGRSGMSTLRALLAGGARVVAWDDGPTARDAVAEIPGVQVADLAVPGALDSVSCLVVSPGVAHLYPAPHPAVAQALRVGVPVDNDIGLFFRSLSHPSWQNFDSPPRVIAVTGSNGKSTTSALINHILNRAGVSCQLAGNIGRGVFDIDPPNNGSVVVLELSSYQTEPARALTPDIAVFTNLSPDHLDRHAGQGGYFAAKSRLFVEGGPDRCIIGIDETEGLYLANRLSQGPGDDRIITVSAGQKLQGPGWSVFTRKGFLAEWRKGRQVAGIDLRNVAGLPGAHNHQNACAAYAACRSLGLAPRVIEAALHDFSGLPHRSQAVGEHGGVRFINDSKATNPDSAAKALAAFSRIRWICGGLQKDGGLDALRPYLNGVLKAYVIGRDAAGFAMQLGDTPTTVCTSMERAVQAAVAEAVPGDVILLAPACASFDQYDNFEQRGDDFVRCVQQVTATDFNTDTAG